MINVRTGKPASPYLDVSGSAFQCYFSPQEDRLVSDSWSYALSVETNSDMKRHLPPKRLLSGRMEFSPNGQSIAVASGGIYDAGTLVLRGQLDAANRSMIPLKLTDVSEHFAFSPDSTRLASGNKDGTLTLWDTAGSTPVFRLSGGETAASALAFNQDGRLLAAGDTSGAVHVYRVPVHSSKSVLDVLGGVG